MPGDDTATGALRLRATDREDLAVLSAALQDSIVPVMDMTYLAEQNRFVMVVNRFKWEACPDAPDDNVRTKDAASPGAYLRTNCGVTFFGVQRVRTRGVDPAKRDDMLSLLAVEPCETGVLLVFSGNAAVSLDLEGGSEAPIDCRLMDLGDPWPTASRPRHVFEEDSDSP